jgi:probable DNA repair protein
LIRLPSELGERVGHGATIVVPSRQRAHGARLAHAAAHLRDGQRVWNSPDILTLEGWLTREIERCATTDLRLPRILSPAEEWLLWRTCAAEATGDLQLVNRGALAEGLRHSSALAADYRIDIAAVRESAGSEPALLRQVQQAVSERTRALGAASLASVLAQLPGIGDSRPVCLAGFLTLTPQLRAIAAARRASGCELTVAERDITRAGPPQVVLAADELQELERIAHWCRRRLEQQPDSRLLIVLGGSPGARERLATLIRQTLDPQGWLQHSQGERSAPSDALVVIEGGIPLASHPAVAHALSTLGWLGGQTGDFSELSEWLRAPYWTVPGSGARARLDLWLRERGPMQLELAELEAVLRHAPAELRTAARELHSRMATAAAVLRRGVASPRDWSQRFREALGAVGWPGDRSRSSADQQTVMRFHELLDEFGQLAAAVGSLSRESAIRLVSERAASISFRPADDDALVTITPMLADPVVRYDGIWVAGLHAETFPLPVQPDAFLPLSTQLAAGVPAASAQGRLQEAHALLAAWRAAADELVLSAPARTEDLELLPSPLLSPWRESRHAPHPGVVWLPARLRREGQLETLLDGAGAPWPTSQALPAGTRSLDLQNQCPFRAYAELRLGSTELGVPEPGIAPDVRGELLHAALQRLWDRLRESSALRELSPGQLEALIRRSVAEAADATWGRFSQRGLQDPGSRGLQLDAFAVTAHPPALARECRRAMLLIKRLCELELERAPFSMQATEFSSTLALAGAELHVRIDRVDRLHEGGCAILDYKSGRRIVADWYGERPSHPQLLAYLVAIGADVVAMATVNVTAREVRFEGIANTAELLPQLKGVVAPDGGEAGDAWALRQREWRSRIEQLAADFLAGRALVDPKPGACDFCHVASVCRIADRGAPESEEEAPDE